MPAYLHFAGSDEAFDLPLGDGPVVPTAGGALFDENPRPERTATTDFTGNELIRLDVPIIFDGWPGRSIEDALWAFIARCRGQDGEPSPSFIVTGPMPFSGVRYVMELPEFGDAIRRPGDGALVRQRLTGKLVQFVNPDRIHPHRSTTQTLHDAPRTVTLPRSMTYLEIAAHYLHDASRGKEVAKLNGDRDPRKRLAAGSKVKVPRA